MLELTPAGFSETNARRHSNSYSNRTKKYFGQKKAVKMYFGNLNRVRVLMTAVYFCFFFRACIFLCRSAYFPSLQDATMGVNDPYSICSIRSLHALFSHFHA